MFKKVPIPFSHWYHLIEGLQESSQQFYSNLEDALNKRQLPKVKLSRVTYREGGLLSAKREYLRVEYQEYIFDICAAPYGTGFFVSWWLGETPVGIWAYLLSVPLLGFLISLFLIAFRPVTYYKIDTAMMFQESVRLGVLEIVDGLVEAKGLRKPSEFERKPIMKGFFTGKK